MRDQGALAWVDISTGAFSVIACSRARLGPELARLAPREVLLSEAADADLPLLVSDMGASATPVSRGAFDSTAGEARLSGLFGVETLDAFGAFGRAEIGAMAAIVDYLEMTQSGNLPLMRPPVAERPGGTMQIDAATRRSLELTHAMGGGRAGSLLAAIDRTVTAGGARLLERRLSSPACDLEVIHARQEAVAALVEDATTLASLRAALKQVHDIERALSRLALDRGGPRDLAAIRESLGQAADLARLLRSAEAPPLLARVADLEGHDALTAVLAQTLVAEPPLLVRDGGVIGPALTPSWTRPAHCATTADRSSPDCRPIMPGAAVWRPCRSSTTTCWAISSRPPRPMPSGCWRRH